MFVAGYDLVPLEQCNLRHCGTQQLGQNVLTTICHYYVVLWICIRVQPFFSDEKKDRESLSTVKKVDFEKLSLRPYAFSGITFEEQSGA